MHPLIARIHPAVRTALFAWLFSRTALWVLHPTRAVELADGAPLPGLVDQTLQQLLGTISAPWLAQVVAATPWVMVEVLILIAGISVYRFARTTDLDRLAERACWLWFFNPLLALNPDAWGMQLAVATGTIAVAAVVTRRPRLSAVATVVAVGCRPEFVVLAPAVALAAWKHCRPPNHSPFAFAASLLAIPAAFTGWIVATWHLGGAAGTSLRSLHGGVSWRDSSSILPASAPEWITLVVLAAVLLLAIRYLKRFPLWYAVAAAPAAIWPLFQEPMYLAATTIAWSLPTFVHLGVATDDRGTARALIVGCAVAFVLIAAP